MPSKQTELMVTRLAPSPTGALHLGNIRTFLITWALARQSSPQQSNRAGRIVMRVEDLDTPRVKPGSTEAMLETLSWLGIDWDGKPRVQSHDLAPYEAAMRCLADAGNAYPCALSRAEIEAAASAPQDGSREVVFPAELRPADAERPHAFEILAPSSPQDAASNWRFLTPRSEILFEDQFAGPQRIDTASTIGDFVVWTKRGLPAYQLAVVVDDAAAGVTDVIRGDDLLDSAARQLLIYRALNLGPEPRYTHVPLVVGTDGRRLAKRHGDTRVERYRESGVSAESLIGLVGFWSGVVRERRPMSAPEFKERFTLSTLPKAPVVFTQEDERWLLSRRGG